MCKYNLWNEFVLFSSGAFDIMYCRILTTTILQASAAFPRPAKKMLLWYAQRKTEPKFLVNKRPRKIFHLTRNINAYCRQREPASHSNVDNWVGSFRAFEHRRPQKNSLKSTKINGWIYSEVCVYITKKSKLRILRCVIAVNNSRQIRYVSV